MRTSIFTVVFSLAFISMVNAQGPRLFLDLPSIYFAAPDVEHIANNMGAGVGVAMNVGTHNLVGRIGGGSDFLLDPKASDLKASFRAVPNGLVQLGAGMYRSNGNRCAKTKANAFTALGKVGLRYDYNTKAPEGIDKGTLNPTVGAELGYFYIRDIFRNLEIVLDVNYMTKSKTIYAGFGFKTFLNLRAGRYKELG